MSPTVKTILKVIGWLAGIVVVLVAGLILFIHTGWDSPSDRPAPDLRATSDSASIARGKYIFMYQAQCWGCHAGPSADLSPLAGGGKLFDLSEDGPGFGKWYARNITPDEENGLGTWTDGEIVQALREGLSKDRTTLFPIMPVDWYHGMADEDVLAVVSYLRSLPAAHNHVPENEPSFFAKALFALKAMAPKERITAPVTAPPRGVTPEYGKYVAQNLAGCADCHTPRNLQDGSFYLDSLFAGSTFPYGGGPGDPYPAFARNITPDVETGIGAWSEEEFILAVIAGMRRDGTVLSPNMPYPHYKFIEPDDLRAVWAYLKTIPPLKRSTPPIAQHPALMDAMGSERGGMIFQSRCQPCHGPEGGGAEPTLVVLADVAPSLTDEELGEFIKAGDLDLRMPAFGKTLSDPELADLIAYIRGWKNP